MKLFGPSWRTGVAGLASLIATLCHTAQALANNQPVDWNLVITGIVTGVGLMTARDNKVTSEDVAASKK